MWLDIFPNFDIMYWRFMPCQALQIMHFMWDNAFHVFLWIFPLFRGDFLISQMRNHEWLKFFPLQVSKAPLMWPEPFCNLGPKTEQLILWSWPHVPMSISIQLNSVCWSQPTSVFRTDESLVFRGDITHWYMPRVNRVTSGPVQRRKELTFFTKLSKPFLTSSWLRLFMIPELNQSLKKDFYI